jgi:hypothetical protein
MRETKNIFLRNMLILMSIIFLIGHVSAICCELTLEEGICIDVADDQYCDDDYRIDRTTACESTQYCDPTGTCVNNKDGTCMPSSSAACDPANGGFWRRKIISQTLMQSQNVKLVAVSQERVLHLYRELLVLQEQQLKESHQIL